MGTICAGLAYYGGLIPFGSTFFVFTDYMRPPIRLAALSGIQTIYVFTHDSICVGEDGPTHEPVEHLATMRAIPRVIDLRPGDANEAGYAWIAALEHKHETSVIMLTRQNIPVFDRTKTGPASGVLKGGYTLWESKPGTTPEIIFIGTGSETTLAFEAAQKFGEEGKAARAVSLPSWALFEAQSQEYRDSVLPPSVTRRVAVEAGIRMGWERYTTTGGKFVGVNKFGASAPYERILKEYGLTIENVIDTAKTLF
jgi:transketolase